MAHLHRWALAFLGSGLGGSSVNAAESAPRQPVSCNTRSRRSKGQVRREPRCQPMKQLIVVKRAQGLR